MKKHTWARGGRGGKNPSEVTSPLPCRRKMGTHRMKKNSYSILNRFSSGRQVAHFMVRSLLFRSFFHFWLLKSCAIYHSKISIKIVKKQFLSGGDVKKNFPPFLLPSPRLWQPKASPMEAFLTHPHI